MARKKSRNWIVSFEVRLDQAATKTMAQDALHIAISQFIAAAGSPGITQDFTIRMKPIKRRDDA